MGSDKDKLIDKLQSENRELRSELVRTKQHLQDLAEVSTDWFWKTDEYLRFVEVGQPYFDITGVPVEKVIGRTRFELVPMEEQQRYPERWKKHRDDMEQRLPFRGLEYAIVGKTGQIHYVRVNGKPVFDDDNHFIGYVGTGTDESARVIAQRKLEEANSSLEQKVADRTKKLVEEISERRKGEDNLRKLRNLLRNIIDSMPSIIVAVDSDSHITQWNKQAENYTGVTVDEALGKPLADMFVHIGIEHERITLAINECRPIKDERIMLQVKDDMHFSDVTIYPLIANGVDGAVIRIDDVSDRVHMEEMMIQSEKMLSIGGLAAGMAHEINNPLAGIMQSIQVIQNRLTPDLKKNISTAQECGVNIEDVLNYITRRGIGILNDQILAASHRASTIVSNMLRFSRKSESIATPQDLGELLDITIGLAENDYDLKKSFDFRQINIERDYDPDMPQVACEAGEIQQVILNLLKNGAQAMCEHGTPIPTFILRLYHKEDSAFIEVQDNGPGMDSATRRRIFEPFFTTKGPGVGTGLGLSISYFIITENHKGMISVESTPGEGTMFKIQLPLG